MAENQVNCTAMGFVHNRDCRALPFDSVVRQAFPYAPFRDCDTAGNLLLTRMERRF